jgi:ribosomal-protein-alanine N-acetyltransferase
MATVPSNRTRYGGSVANGSELRTARLLLRRWRDSDRAPFAALNADPEVMRHFPKMLTADESDAFVDRVEAAFGLHGYGLWAVERDGGFIGFVGLNWTPFNAHFTPALEIGWRLARSAWGQGYATEAALAARDFAFAEAGVAELVSFTTAANTRSQAVMERIGLVRAPDGDFDHPHLPAGHPMLRLVLYRMPANRWSGGDVAYER